MGDPLSQWSQYGNAPGRKLAAAAMLILDAIDRLRASEIATVADELHRRELELTGRALVDLVRELAGVLTSMRASLGSDACPLCGWSRPPAPSGRCPRCQQIREAADDPDDLQARLRERRRQVRAV